MKDNFLVNRIDRIGLDRLWLDADSCETQNMGLVCTYITWIDEPLGTYYSLVKKKAKSGCS